jgi:hypothetical protein
LSDETKIDSVVQPTTANLDDIALSTDANEADDVNDASNKSPLDLLKDRIAARLLVKLEEKPNSYLEESETIYLSERSTDDLNKMFFGKIYDYEQEGEEQNSDYYQKLDSDLCEEELSTLIDNEFSEEILTLAEFLDQDPDDLENELKEDEAFTPSELQWSGHFTSFNYSGDVTATADMSVAGVSLTSSAKPCSELFATLHALRITPKNFLQAAKAKMVKDDEQIDDHEKWGMNTIEGNAKSLFHAYRTQFNRELEKEEILQCLSFDFSMPPVVDLDELVFCMTDRWLGRDGLKISMALSADVIDDFSRKISSHYDEKDRDNLSVMVTNGYIGVESLSYLDNDLIKIISPISVPLSSLRTLTERPDRDMEGSIELHPKEATYTKIYKLAHQNDQITQEQRQSEKMIAALSNTVSKIIAGLPGHSIAKVRFSTSGKAWGNEKHNQHAAWVHDEVTRQLDAHEKKCLSASKKEMGRALLYALQSWRTDTDCRDKSLWLIKHGADVNLKTTNGFSAIHLAARLNDVDLMGLLVDAGADINVKRVAKGCINEETPLSFALRYLIGSHMANFGQLSAFGTQGTQSALDWLVDKEVAVADGIVLAKNGEHSYGHITHLAYSGGEAMADKFARVLFLDERQRVKEDHQNTVDVLFKQAVHRIEPKLGAVLIDAGANLDFKIKRSGTSEEISPEAALRKLAEEENAKSYKYEDKISRANDFAQMIMVMRAKRAIDSVIKKTAAVQKVSQYQ